MLLLLHIIIKENIITKLQKLYSLHKNPRAGNKLPALCVKNTSLHRQFIAHAQNIHWKACNPSFLGNPHSLHWYFVNPAPLKIKVFSEPQKYYSFSYLTSSYILKVTKFCLNFPVWILSYDRKVFLFRNFFCK